MKFLKKEHKEYHSLVKYHLHKAMARWEPQRPIMNIHASEVTKEGTKDKFCAREFCIRDSLPIIQGKKSFINTSLSYTFDMGNATADLFNEKWLVKKAYGNWLCLGCDKLFKFCKRPAKCKCGCKNFRYQEYRFISAESGIGCGIDTMLGGVLPDGKLLVVELKIMKGEDFKELKAPLAEHSTRTNLYLRCIAESTDIHAPKVCTTEARILYMARSYGFKDKDPSGWGLHGDYFSPFKEFKIERNDKHSDPYFHKGQSVYLHRKKKGPMPSRICANSLEPRAQVCPVMTHCFKLKA